MPRCILLALGASWALIPVTAVADGFKVTPVPSAMRKADGMSMPSALSPELFEVVAAAGAMPLENATPLISHYGYAADGRMFPPANSVQGKDNKVEASKTEPDKNTYLVLKGQRGPDGSYDYGTHFLFQGHEAGATTADGKAQGYLTRINLDADVRHRVTLMADHTVDGAPLPYIDGSTSDPFAKRLLLTSEEGDEGGLWQATLDFPSKVENLTGIAGFGSYEGVQVDSDGALWIVEDWGGKTSQTVNAARQPNSFIYRFTPDEKTDLLQGGKLEALEIMDSSGKPITFHENDIDGDVKSQGLKDLHSYGTKLKTRWVRLHDTNKDGTAPFNANKLAKIAGATPLKRPENGQFRPGANFAEFVFDETGDTNAETAAGTEYGGFGAVLMLTQAAPSSTDGEITIVYRCDLAHAGFDNVAVWSAHQMLFVEDAGDKLHSQRDALDSGYIIDLAADRSKDAVEPVRFLAQGRDDAATIDTGLAALKDTGFQNDGDNEITGMHVSDGDPTPAGLLGAKVPMPFENGWRVFYTQQHGDNITWEILRKEPPRGNWPPVVAGQAGRQDR